MEYSHKHDSILIQYNAHRVIVDVMSAWPEEASVICNCIYILSSMAGCDVNTRNKLLNEGVMEQLRLELDDAYKLVKFGRYTIEIWENS